LNSITTEYNFLGSMKKLLSPTFVLMLIVIAISVAHCSKEEIQQNLITKAMTEGQWVVQQFTENSQDLSSEFTPFTFQFYENGQVQAINGTTITNGTWVGDANARTITSTFPATNNTLQRLNDTWQIFNNTFTMVEANPTTQSRIAYLKLVKK
jgi:hypothetical protein